MSETAIALTGISKRYGTRLALSDLTLTVPRGAFFALLGTNGAGKTTTLRTLLGLIRPDSGSGTVLGQTLGPGYPPVELKQRIGYVAEGNPLYSRMTARQLLDLVRDLNPRWNERLVQRYLKLFSLPLDVIVRRLSTGMRAQLALTLAMAGDPELLILDEPTHGLDPLRRHEYLQALLADSIESGRTILMASHELHQVERLADHIAILDAGRLLISASVDSLKENERRVRVAVDWDARIDGADGPGLAETLQRLPGVRRLTREGDGFLLHVSRDLAALLERLQALPSVRGVQVHEESLEEIFLSYVGQT
ncbi:MAG: ATP-binding cassette domain-containing protein [Chloroflexota bacterium]